MTSRSVSSLGVFTALVAALGFLLSGVPNVELMTLGAFVSGAVLGAIRGAIVGAAAMAIYSSLNPYGVAPPPVFATQVAGLALVGSAGGPFREAAPGTRLGPAAGVAVGAALGFGLTFVYDALTNLGTAWSIGAWRDPWPILWGGIAFAIWHMVGNAVFFAVCVPPLFAALRRRRARSL